MKQDQLKLNSNGRDIFNLIKNHFSTKLAENIAHSGIPDIMCLEDIFKIAMFVSSVPL